MSNLEEICDAFESAWQDAIESGSKSPLIEDFLATASSNCDIDQVLHELLMLEFEYAQVSEDRDLPRFLERFADQSSVVQNAFDAHRNLLLEDDSPSTEDEVNTELGRFQLMKFHCSGGLGSIWIAKDHEVEREVALKEIRREFAGFDNLQEQFSAEVLLTGQLEHPGVVPIYGFGKREDGRPFYAMRFIKGRSLLEAIANLHESLSHAPGGLSQSTELRGLLRRFVSVCQTIEYAHSRFIIHRDIKPHNIMLGPFGETLVVDWGLAKRVSSVRPSGASGGHSPSRAAPRVGSTYDTLPPSERNQNADGSTHDDRSTAGGGTVGTPGYMSPEQADGKLGPTHFASDIFSLGATLYHLLTGRPPISAANAPDPISAVIQSKVVPPRAINRGIPKSLEAVCMKALARSAEHRYQSAGKLADDVDRWLDDAPVEARQENLVEKLGRWARHNRRTMGVTFVATVIIALIATGSAIWINELYHLEEKARREANENEKRATRAAFATQQFSASKIASTDPARALDLLLDLDRCPESMRGFAWHYLYRSCRRDRIRWQAHALQSPAGPTARLIGISSTGALWTYSTSGRICAWDLNSGELLDETNVERSLQVCRLNPRGNQLAIASTDGRIELAAITDVSSRRTIQDAGPVIADMAYIPDEDSLITLHAGDSESKVRVWDLATESKSREFSVPFAATVLSVSADSQWIGIGGREPASEEQEISFHPRVSLVQVADGTMVSTWGESLWNPERDKDDEVSSLQFLDPKTIVVGSKEGLVFALDVSEPGIMSSEFALPNGDTDHMADIAHNGALSDVEIIHSSSKTRAITSGVGIGAFKDIDTPDKPIAFWEVPHQSRPSMVGYMAGVQGDVLDTLVLTSSDSVVGDSLVELNSDGTIAIHEIVNWTQTPFEHPGTTEEAEVTIQAIAFSEDSSQLTTLALDLSTGLQKLYHWDTRYSVQSLRTEDFDPSQSWIYPSRLITGAVLGESNATSLRFHNPVTSREVCSFSLDPEERLLAVSADGKQLALQVNNQVQIVATQPNTDSGSSRKPLKSIVGNAIIARFAPESRYFVWADAQGQVHTWDAVTDQTNSLPLPPHSYSAFRFSPDSQFLALAKGEPRTESPCSLNETRLFQTTPSQDSSVVIWNLEQDRLQCTLRGHTGNVQAMDFTSDSTEIATGGLDWEIKIWDPVSGTEITSSAQPGAVTAIEYSPNDQFLATASCGKLVKLWRATSPQTVLKHVEQEARLLVARFWQECPLKSSVRNQIDSETSISMDVRVKARELINQLQEDPEELNQWSWIHVSVPGESTSDYERALAAAKAAFEQKPTDPNLANTLGAAFYRTNDLQAALRQLRKSAELARLKYGGPQATDHAFLAMVYAKLGDAENAESELQALLSYILDQQEKGVRGLNELIQLWNEGRMEIEWLTTNARPTGPQILRSLHNHTEPNF